MREKEQPKTIDIISLIISIFALFISIFTFIFSTAPRFNFLSHDTIKKAEDGDFKSQMYLADIYLKTNEYENSYYWYRLAALNIDNEDVGFAYAALGFLGNNGYFSSENSSLSHNIEQTINFYDNAIHYAEQNQYNTAIQKQIYINYLVFLLSNENPKSEIDTNGNLIESKYLNTTDSFIHNNISKIKELLNKLYYLDNDLFKNMDNLSFPIEDEIFLEKYINGDNIPIKKWVYDYTTIASKGNLAYVRDTEKLVYIDDFAEPIDNVSFSYTVKYKYYHYVLNIEQQDAPDDFISNFKEKYIEYES